MKKLLIFIFAIAVVSLSSCLKDKPNTDFSSIGTVLELPYAGLQYFNQDAVTSSADTIVMSFGVNIASAKTLSTDTKYTVAVDYSLMTAYNAAHTAIAYVQLPEGSYTLNKTSGTIKAGQRLDSVKVTIYKNQLDPSKSYMLPIKLASTSNGILSGNFNAHYYHIIGNPFAGSYTWNFTRYNNSTGTGSPAGGTFTGGAVTIYPVIPTQFEVVSGYYLQTERYEVTFSQPDATHFNNFQIAFNAADVASVFTANGISITQNPVFGYGTAYDSSATYTYAQSLAFFTFQYVVFNGTAFRYCIDNYVHN
jgi:hypothetical protein